MPRGATLGSESLQPKLLGDGSAWMRMVPAVAVTFLLSACNGGSPSAPLPSPTSKVPTGTASLVDDGMDGSFCAGLREKIVQENARRGDESFGGEQVNKYPACFGLPTG